MSLTPKQTAANRITTRDASDHFVNGKLGNLTQKQYAALERVAQLSPGYSFEVMRYNEHNKHKGSTATHVSIYFHKESVALVGRGCAQYYDGKEATEQAVKRVSRMVYGQSAFFAP